MKINQWEAILLQDVTNRTEFKFQNKKITEYLSCGNNNSHFRIIMM